MPVEIIERYDRKTIQANPEKIYVFGDNCVREGRAGQAKECRGEPNVIGVRTKFLPNMKPEAFFNDSYRCYEFVEQDIGDIWDKLFNGYTIVLPKDGVGTGLADLPNKAPKLHKYIQAQFTAMRYYASSDSL